VEKPYFLAKWAKCLILGFFYISATIDVRVELAIIFEKELTE
jgi:hypothetical protein